MLFPARLYLLTLFAVPFALAACEDSKPLTIGGQEITVSDTVPDDYDGAIRAVKHKLDQQPLPWWEVSQGLNPEQRRAFWFTPQGSKLLPLSWAKHLLTDETIVTDSSADHREDRFFGKKNMARFGYISPPDGVLWNPHNLPIGFAHVQLSPLKADEGYDEYNEDLYNLNRDEQHWVGPTCAACHTNMMQLNGTPVLVDGAGTLADFESMNEALVEALASLTDFMGNNPGPKWEKFYRDVLGPNPTDAAIALLEKQVVEYSMQLIDRNADNRAVYEASYQNPDHPRRYGHGRLDAVGALFNKAAGTIAVMNEPGTNMVPADAPVSYPFLWGTAQSDVVQWNGFAPNNALGLGSLTRNVGEVVGVYGEVQVVDKSEGSYTSGDDSFQETGSDGYFGYKSSVKVNNLGYLEKWNGLLRAPKWPANLLGALDQEKVTQGSLIYREKGCHGCHEVIARQDEGEGYIAKMIEARSVGTDQTFANNFMLKRDGGWLAGKLENSLGVDPFEGGAARMGKTSELRANFLVNVSLNVMANQAIDSARAAHNGYEKARKGRKAKITGTQYKARPLTGIWATAPYLHNGSVPDLYSLLLPEEARPVEFYVGSNVFDPQKVGFDSNAAAGRFKYDTRQPGNSNKGHNFTATLTADERLALLEYLKSL